MKRNDLLAIGCMSIVASVIAVAFLVSPRVTETGLNEALGWNALGLSTTNSPNGWAQGLVDSTDEATSFQPFGSGPLNARVTIRKGVTLNGCATVQATVAPMYLEDIPGYDAKRGAEPRETITAVREVCKRVDA